MKKQTTKKLKLKRETIRSLSAGELSNVGGGGVTSQAATCRTQMLSSACTTI